MAQVPRKPNSALIIRQKKNRNSESNIGVSTQFQTPVTKDDAGTTRNSESDARNDANKGLSSVVNISDLVTSKKRVIVRKHISKTAWNTPVLSPRATEKKRIILKKSAIKLESPIKAFTPIA